MIKLYQLAKSMHRVLVFGVSGLLLFMAITGIMLRYSRWTSRLGVDTGLIRHLHGALSMWAAAAFIVMVLTGLVMYIYPFYVRRGRGASGTATTHGQEG